MKLSAKPISSPGRTDNFPPPLMRFLRSNAGSRSRGRSRSSTMLFIKKKNTTIETQEPSSPKVTCMGQVRVRRSSKQPAAKRGGTPTKCRRSRWWVPKPGSCYHCNCQPVWRFFGGRKASKVTEASKKPDLIFRGRHKQEESKNQERVNANAFVSNSPSSTPPRNALLLTRCRSAPYRSSSLASRFWDSELENRESTDNERPNLQRESISEQEEKKDPKFELKLRFFKELEDSLRESIIDAEKVHELKRREEGEGESPRPLGLTRCKSEPARNAQKLHPQLNDFWKKTRLGFDETYFT